MNQISLLLTCAAAITLLSTCATAPSVEWADTPLVMEQREYFFNRLVNLQPKELRTNVDMQEEARWLTTTAYKGAAAVGRVNDPSLASWLNNRLVNSSFNLKERGLCWQYQHDLYRELRRRPLYYFRLGCCVMDHDEGSEHHCVYITARHKHWPDAIVFDGWWNSGKLKIWLPSTLKRRECQDEPAATAFLNAFYPEGHTYPIEHWARVKGGHGMRDYVNSDTPEGRATRQGQLMERRMREGLQQRNGKPTDY